MRAGARHRLRRGSLGGRGVDLAAETGRKGVELGTGGQSPAPHRDRVALLAGAQARHAPLAAHGLTCPWPDDHLALLERQCQQALAFWARSPARPRLVASAWRSSCTRCT